MTWRNGGKAWLGALSGVLIALSLPGIGAWPLVFVGLIPLFFSLEKSHGFAAGAAFGLALFGLDLRWMLTLYRFTPWVVPGFVILVLALSLPTGFLGWLLAWQRKRRPVASWGLAAICSFTLLEFARALGPLGMGFSALHLSLYQLPIALQLVAILGPWSITACIVAVNASLYVALRRREARWLAGAGAAALLLLLPAALPIANARTESVRAAVIASTVEQEVKLSGENLGTLTDRYMRLGAGALESHPDLLVFPESFLPAYILRRSEISDRLADLARKGETRVLFGTGEFRDGEIYNSVVLLATNGEVSGVYDMVRPVPFGEYIPGRAVWRAIGLGPLMNSFLTLDLTPGRGAEPLQEIATPICFESTFPQGARLLVRKGAELIATVTNDAWFVRSSELEAHFAFAVFRAIENRRWLIQAANGGVSGLVAPDGRVTARRVSEGVLVGNVYPRSDLSAYTRWGDTPLLILLGLGLASAVLPRRTTKREGE